MSILKLNSIPNSVFMAKDVAEKRVRVNGSELSRRAIVQSGRLVACENIGKRLNSRANAKTLGLFESQLEKINSKYDYATLSKLHNDSKFMFCATIAYNAAGKEAPENVDVARNDISLQRNIFFLNAMAAIDQDVIQPLIFRVFDDVSASGLMKLEPVRLGATKEITVRSNDAVIFEDADWGSFRNVSNNYLYAQTITLTPTPKAAKIKIKWYEQVVNGDAGDYYAALINGLYNKIYAMFNSALVKASADTKYMPSGLTVDTFTNANWAKLIEKVAAVNNVNLSDLVAYGRLPALNCVLPQTGESGATAALQTMLGEEWFKTGYVSRAGQVDLALVNPAVVPHTQNSSIKLMFPDDEIYIVAKAGHAPIVGCYTEGSPVTITANWVEQEDNMIMIECLAPLAVAPVFASKVGHMTGVSSD